MRHFLLVASPSTNIGSIQSSCMFVDNKQFWNFSV
jgi:hypothetical protein